MIKFVFLIFCSVITASCQNSNDRAVKNSFNSFYNSYKHHKDFREIPRDMLSENLLNLIDLAEKKEKQSAENIKLSSFPSDKPDIIEGDVFSSLYEGFNEYKILSHPIKDDTARLNLELKNTDFKPITKWNDECIMIKENGKWKIDNFIFSNKDNSGYKNTQNIFRSFLRFENPPEK